MAPISFGIELEFNVAFLLYQRRTPVGETRTLIFPDPAFEDLTLGPQNSPLFFMTKNRVRNHIAILLYHAGFPVNLRDPSAVTMNYWQVTDDFTIKAPEEGEPDYVDQYGYVGVELKTPALEFSEKNMADVKKVCNLINETYVASCNPSTGLHVHIGHFDAPEPFPLEFLKKFVSFMYVFDPQISSLHSMERVTGEWSTRMRDAAELVSDFQQEHGYRPLAADLIPRFQAAKNSESLIVMVVSIFGKHNAINFNGVRRANLLRNAHRGEGNTLEFRQHRGTVDGQEVCMWVRTVAGMVKFIEEAFPHIFSELITTIMKADTWEKEFDGGDGEREQKYGPIPADGPFTIVDLLNHIGLTEEASYYEDKWIIHSSDIEPRSSEARHKDRGWKFLTEFNSDAPEYQNGMRLTEIWERMRAYDSMRDRERNTGWSWDEDASYWPERRRSNGP